MAAVVTITICVPIYKWDTEALRGLMTHIGLQLRHRVELVPKPWAGAVMLGRWSPVLMQLMCRVSEQVQGILICCWPCLSVRSARHCLLSGARTSLLRQCLKASGGRHLLTFPGSRYTAPPLSDEGKWFARGRPKREDMRSILRPFFLHFSLSWLRQRRANCGLENNQVHSCPLIFVASRPMRLRQGASQEDSPPLLGQPSVNSGF